MNKNVKIGATGMGAVATLFAATLSLGAGGQGHARPTDSIRGTDIAEADRELTSILSTVDHPRRLAWGTSASHLATSVSDPPDGSTATSGSGLPDGSPGTNAPLDADASNRSGENGSKGISVTIPRRVTVTFPDYQGGSLPSVTPPSYQPGTPPSVKQNGRQIVIDLGESGSMSPPEVKKGESGTFTPPRIIIE